jgi:hypothetical protein
MRWGWILMALGFVGALPWSMAMGWHVPSWFDGSGHCQEPIVDYYDSTSDDVTTRWFPPRVTLHLTNPPRTFDCISSGETLVLTVTAVVLALLLLGGLVLLAWHFLVKGPSAEAEARRNLMTRGAGVWWMQMPRHVLAAWIVGSAVSVLGAWFVINSAFIMGESALVLSPLASLLAVVFFAAVLDAEAGPRRGGLLASRRRGAVVGVIGSTTVLALYVLAARQGVASFPGPLLYPNWTWIAAGIPFAATAAFQWLTPRSAQPQTLLSAEPVVPEGNAVQRQ